MTFSSPRIPLGGYWFSMPPVRFVRDHPLKIPGSTEVSESFAVDFNGARSLPTEPI